MSLLGLHVASGCSLRRYRVGLQTATLASVSAVRTAPHASAADRGPSLATVTVSPDSVCLLVNLALLGTDGRRDNGCLLSVCVLDESSSV